MWQANQDKAVRPGQSDDLTVLSFSQQLTIRKYHKGQRPPDLTVANNAMYSGDFKSQIFKCLNWGYQPK